MERHPRRRLRRPARREKPRRHRPSRRPGQGPRLVWRRSPRSRDRADGSSGIPARSTSPSAPAGSTTRPRTTRSRRSTNSSTSYYTSVGGNAQLLLNIPPDKRGRIHENDARRLKELGDRLRATFADNLAAKATASMTYVMRAVHEIGLAPAAGYEGEPDRVLEWTSKVRRSSTSPCSRKTSARGSKSNPSPSMSGTGRIGTRKPAARRSAGRSFCVFPTVETTKVRVRILRTRGGNVLVDA